MQAQAQCSHKETGYVPVRRPLAELAPPGAEVEPWMFEPRWFVDRVCAGCRVSLYISIDDFDSLEEAQGHATLLELADITVTHCGPEGDLLCASLFGQPDGEEEEGGDDAGD